MVLLQIEMQFGKKFCEYTLSYDDDADQLNDEYCNFLQSYNQ